MDGHCLHFDFFSSLGVRSVGVGRRYLGQAKCYRLHCGHTFFICSQFFSQFFSHLLSIF